MTRLASLISTLALATTLGATGCIISDSGSDLTVTNNSSFDIQDLYLTKSTSAGWGANHLGSNPLLPGESITLAGIACDTYDVLMVDETGAMCEHDNLDLCLSSSSWIITNNTCAVFARQAPPIKDGEMVHQPRAASQQ